MQYPTHVSVSDPSTSNPPPDYRDTLPRRVYSSIKHRFFYSPRGPCTLAASRLKPYCRSAITGSKTPVGPSQAIARNAVARSLCRGYTADVSHSPRHSAQTQVATVDLEALIQSLQAPGRVWKRSEVLARPSPYNRAAFLVISLSHIVRAEIESQNPRPTSRFQASTIRSIRNP